jgi:hypothetical protein
LVAADKEDDRLKASHCHFVAALALVTGLQPVILYLFFLSDFLACISFVPLRDKKES